MVIIAKRRLITIICFFIAFASAASTVSIISADRIAVFSKKQTKIIVIDAGHGLPDGGAVGINGTIESTVNLKVAQLVEKKLKKLGYKIIMTRTDENSISDCEGDIAVKKRNDMKNRLKIVNSSNADIFVSIHMNKFPDSSSCGAQVLYSSNFEESQRLAEIIQESLWHIEENPSKRAALRAPNSLYLMRNAAMPAVIAECGFLSNFNDEKNLNTKKYQNELAEAIARGIASYYKEIYANMKKE